MRDRLVLCVLSALGSILAGGCGKEIGDACIIASDCSPNGDRICIDSTSNGDGYCTIQGCDIGTCPEEAACVQFFTGNFQNKICDPDPDHPEAPDHNPDPDAKPCSPDELCALDGHCVPRSSEIRYCMRTCASEGDCRDGYECRDLELMKTHGGQPLLAQQCTTTNGQTVCTPTPIDSKAPRFCAKQP